MFLFVFYVLGQPKYHAKAFIFMFQDGLEHMQFFYKYSKSHMHAMPCYISDYNSHIMSKLACDTCRAHRGNAAQ